MPESSGSRYPMLLSPVFKPYIWGGERLVTEFGKATNMRPVAESWELSCHPDGLTTVGSGVYAGCTLADVLREHPDWIRAYAGTYPDMPVLIKLIDASQNLSLQVHPDDGYAREHEDSAGKNEAWYIVDCEPGACLILGLSDNLPGDGITNLIEDGSILNYANRVPVKPGDCFYVPAGMLHAICGGVLIAEIQQSSNVTYRVYDYGRLGPDGKPRPLHISHAVNVINTGLQADNCSEDAVIRRYNGYNVADLIDWRYFKLSRIDINGVAPLSCGDAFQAILVVSGNLELSSGAFDHIRGSTTVPGDSIPASKGSCLFIPAGFGEYTLHGEGRVLLTTI